MADQVASIEFQSWVAKLATIRVQERSIEGQHSRVSKILKRAPSASMALISHELRWHALSKLVTSQPSLLEVGALKVLMIEKVSGFRAAVL